jgi:hypothetical protein
MTTYRRVPPTRYKSRTTDEWYTVTVSKMGGVVCTCPGFYYHRHCWHADKVLDRLDTTKYRR